MNFKKRLPLFSIFFALMVFGCETHNTMTFTPTASQIQLTPYLTATKGTAFIKSNNLPTKTQLISPIPSPTPTPYLYIIVEGDTFTSIVPPNSSSLILISILIFLQSVALLQFPSQTAPYLFSTTQLHFLLP